MLINRDTVCTLKVRYTKDNELQNKFIGLKYLKESSTAQAIYDVTKEKLMNLDENIGENLCGYVHDHASNLSGCANGLGQL